MRTKVLWSIRAKDGRWTIRNDDEVDPSKVNPDEWALTKFELLVFKEDPPKWRPS